MVHPISFRANFIQNITAQRINLQGEYEDHNLALVELSHLSDNDMQAVEKIAWNWQSLAMTIFGNMQTRLMNVDMGESRKNFAITRQRENFEKLIPENILCIAETNNEEDILQLKYIMVHPNEAYPNYFRKYKNIGHAFLNFLKKQNPKKNITVNTLPGAIDFYLKEGFKKVKGTNTTMMYKIK